MGLLRSLLVGYTLALLPACTPPHFRAADAGDAGASADASVHAPAPPAAPIAPLGAPSIAWLPGTDAASLAAASPLENTVDAPAFGDCGTWDGGGASPCEPWVGGAPLTCPDGMAQFPGDDSCGAIGSACPAAGEWAADLGPSTVDVVYVRAGSVGGDGSRTAPYATLAEGIAATTASAARPFVVALAAGTYAGAATVPDHVTLWGACVEGTRVVGSGAADNLTLGSGSRLTNLAVQGGANAIMVPADVVGAIVDRVLVEDPENGVGVDRGELTATRLVVRRATSTQAMLVSAGRLTLDQALVSDASGYGIGAIWNSTLTLTDVAIRNVGGDGVQATLNGAHVFADGLVVEHAIDGVETAIALGAPGMLEVHLQRAVLRDLSGGGVGTLNAASVEVSRTLVQRARAHGLRLHGPSTVADVSILDIARAATAPADWHFDGFGVYTWDSQVSLDRVSIARTESSGVVSSSGRLVVTSLDVRETGHGLATAGVKSDCIEVEDHGPSLTLRRAHLEGCAGVGVRLDGCSEAPCPGLTATLEDTTIVGTIPSPTGGAANGSVVVTGPSDVALTRVVVRGGSSPQLAVGRDSTGIGVADAVATIELHDVLLSSAAGSAIVADDGAQISGGAVVVTGAASAAIAAAESGTLLTLSDLVVVDAAAVAIDVTNGAAAAFTRASITRAAVASRVSGGSLSLTDARLEGTGALAVDGGGSLVLMRAVALSLGAALVRAAGAGTSLHMADVRASGAGEGGVPAVLVRGSAVATLEGVALDLNGGAAVLATERGTVLDASDLDLRFPLVSTAPSTGVAASSSAEVTLHRVRVDHARGLGIVAERAVVSGDDVRVTATDAADCGGGPCAAALVSRDLGRVELTRFALEGSASVGAAVLADGSMLTLTSGAISDASVGLVDPGSTAQTTDVIFERCGAAQASSPVMFPASPGAT